MEHLDKIIEMSDAEFGAIAKNGKYKSREEIDSVYKLMDIVKDAYCIMDIEESMDDMSYADGMSYERRGGRSYRGGSYDGSYDGGSYARGRRNARRDERGRYSREYRDGRSYRGYSRDGQDEYKEQLMDLLESAPDEQTRQSVQRMLDQMK